MFTTALGTPIEMVEAEPFADGMYQPPMAEIPSVCCPPPISVHVPPNVLVGVNFGAVVASREQYSTITPAPLAGVVLGIVYAEGPVTSVLSQPLVSSVMPIATTHHSLT